MRRYLPSSIALLTAILATGGPATPASAASPALRPPAAAPTATAPPATTAVPVAPAARPPMGWNSWNAFHCDGLNETMVRGMADAIVDKGLAQLGYQYVNLDDCWMASSRDGNGNLQADPSKFPHGIRDLADYVHGKGLKLGIYESAGTETCEHRPGSLGHETADATAFAAWGVDYLKYDNCGNEGQPDAVRYKAMGDALKATGRPIVYSVCNWGLASPWLFGPGTGAALWRTTGDIYPSWNSLTTILDQQAGLELFSRPSGWNDPDMLEVGVTKDGNTLTTDENIAHFSLWALLNAPLLLGNDVRAADSTILSILSNPDVIAVDQDWGGSQGRRVRDLGNQEIWAKPMSDGSVATVLFNRDGAPTTISTTAAELGLTGSSAYALRDLWSKATSTSTSAVSATVPGHGAVMIRVSRASAVAAGLASGTHQLGDLDWSAVTNGWGPAERNISNGEKAAGDGHTITIGGTQYPTGLGVHVDSGIHVHLGRTCSAFTSAVGVDAEVGSAGSVRFAVYGDGRLLSYSDTLTGGRTPVTLTVAVAGVADLELRVTDNRDGDISDHADWGDAMLTC
jgi:alpha-galactosidase